MVELLVVEGQVERGGGGVEDAQAFGDDFGADSVAGDDGDAVCSRHGVLLFQGVVRWGCSAAVDRVVGFAAVEDVDDGMRGGEAGAGAGLDGLAGQV